MLQLVPCIRSAAQESTDPSEAATFLASVMSNVDSARAAGKYDQALRKLDSAAQILNERYAGQGLDDVLMRRSSTLQMLGDNGKALTELYRAQQLRRENSDQLGLAEVNNNIGSIHQLQREYEKAAEY